MNKIEIMNIKKLDHPVLKGSGSDQVYSFVSFLLIYVSSLIFGTKGRFVVFFYSFYSSTFLFSPSYFSIVYSGVTVTSELFSSYFYVSTISSLGSSTISSFFISFVSNSFYSFVITGFS